MPFLYLPSVIFTAPLDFHLSLVNKAGASLLMSQDGKEGSKGIWQVLHQDTVLAWTLVLPHPPILSVKS